MTVIEFAGISDFIGCYQKYENSYSEVIRFILLLGINFI